MPGKKSSQFDIIIKLVENAEKKLKEINNQLGKTDKKATKASKGVVKLNFSLRKVARSVLSLKGALLGLGVGLLAKSFLKAADTAEQYRVRLNILLGSQREGNRLFKDMSDFAATVSFSYENIMGSATQLAGVMQGGVDQIGEWMPLISDLAAVSGLGIEATTTQVIRMYSAGAASADLFRERGLLAMLGFTSGVKVSAKETRKRLLEAWKDPASKFRDGSVELAKSWSGMLQMIGDAWFQFRNMVMDSGVFEFMKAGVGLFLEKIRELKKEGTLDEWAESLANKVMSSFRTMSIGLGYFIDGFYGLKVLFVALEIAFSKFGESLNTGLLRASEGAQSLGNKIKEGFGKVALKTDIFRFFNDEDKEYLRNLGSRKIQTEEQRVFKENAELWKKGKEEAIRTFDELIAKFKDDSAVVRITALFDKVKAKADAAFAARKEALESEKQKPRVQLVPEAKLSNIFRSRLLKLSETAKTQFAILASLYKDGELELEKYFDKRQKLMIDTFNKEMLILIEREKAAEDPNERLKAQDKIFSKQQDHQRKLLAFEDEKKAAEEELAKKKVDVQRILDDAKARAADTSSLETEHKAEMDALKRAQEDEIQLLVDKIATKEQLEEAHRLHVLEQDKLLSEQRKAIEQRNVEATKLALGEFADAFGAAYKISHEKGKAFARAQQLVAVAQTMISAYEGAQKAYTALVGLGPAGPALAAAAAGAAIVAGLGRVAAIKAQSFARGGMIGGYSPTSTSDNIPINTTAGEFVEPVKSVRAYGLPFMRAIQNLQIPPSVIAGLMSGVKTLKTAPNTAPYFAGGGSVGAGQLRIEANKGEKTEPPVIANFIDPTLFEQFAATRKGQDMYINVLSNRAGEVKAILASE